MISFHINTQIWHKHSRPWYERTRNHQIEAKSSTDKDDKITRTNIG